MSSFLVTGAAGFIGYHIALKLLEEGKNVVGLDNLNDYYDVSLKNERLRRLKVHPNFKFVHSDLVETAELSNLFETEIFLAVIHLAAQAGVRHSLTHPHAYISSNIDGFLNILEACRHHKVGHLIFASSSSVYGAVTKMPFSVLQNVDHPVSLYAATKKANELMAHSYSHLYRLPTTGLRFFTVYGPWGRPDMALFLFTKAILNDEPINIFNNGRMQRDFTFVDDIVEGIARLVSIVPQPDPAWDGNNPTPATSAAPYKVYNIGNNSPVDLMKVIEILERCLGKKSIKRFLPMQPGDVPATYADIEDFSLVTGFRPRVSIEVGIERFVSWFRDYYRI